VARAPAVTTGTFRRRTDRRCHHRARDSGQPDAHRLPDARALAQPARGCRAGAAPCRPRTPERSAAGGAVTRAIATAQRPPRRGSSRSGETLPGRASWYGPGFAGRTTACGGTFDPEQLTLASRELDCGTQVLITGPTGRSVQAVVTDWGPAEWTGRRFDLSRATFEAIADLGAGVVDVTVDLL